MTIDSCSLGRAGSCAILPVGCNWAAGKVYMSWKSPQASYCDAVSPPVPRCTSFIWVLNGDAMKIWIWFIWNSWRCLKFPGGFMHGAAPLPSPQPPTGGLQLGNCHLPWAELSPVHSPFSHSPPFGQCSGPLKWVRQHLFRRRWVLTCSPLSGLCIILCISHMSEPGLRFRA